LQPFQNWHICARSFAVVVVVVNVPKKKDVTVEGKFQGFSVGSLVGFQSLINSFKFFASSQFAPVPLAVKLYHFAAVPKLAHLRPFLCGGGGGGKCTEKERCYSGGKISRVFGGFFGGFFLYSMFLLKKNILYKHI
jgi:hypothetical protein